MYRIDLAKESGNIEYGKIGQEAQKLLMDYIDALPEKHQLRAVAGIIRKQLGKWDMLGDEDLMKYIERVLAESNESTIEYIKQSPYNATAQIKNKLEILVEAHRQKRFNDMQNTDQILLLSSWSFREEIILPTVSPALEKSLYERE